MTQLYKKMFVVLLALTLLSNNITYAESGVSNFFNDSCKYVDTLIKNNETFFKVAGGCTAVAILGALTYYLWQTSKKNQAEAELREKQHKERLKNFVATVVSTLKNPTVQVDLEKFTDELLYFLEYYRPHSVTQTPIVTPIYIPYHRC